MTHTQLFFIPLFLLFYTFAGYPILLFFISLFLKKEIKRATILPEVTIIIPVHNEEKTIRNKLDNCLAASYPEAKLKIVVVSDNSTDDTERVVKSFPEERVNFLSLPFRGGKVMAQNYAVNQCNSEIVIFTDVAITTEPNSIKTIVENFNDPSIGAVSCKDVIIGDALKTRGEGGYIKYDMLVRRLTTKVGSLIGVTGGFYAVRIEIAKGGWNPAFPPDFYVALRTIKRGLRVIEDDRVKAYYKTSSKEWDELPRKVRTITRGMTALFSKANRTLLNPFKYGLITLELFSHKIFRWMTPFFLVFLFFFNILALNSHPFLKWILCLQIMFYLVGIILYFGPAVLRKSGIFKIIFYFMIANVSIVLSWFGFLTGKRYVKWQPTKR